MELIDKSALVAELEKRIEETKGMQPKFDQFYAGQISAFKGVLKILDTIEVKEMDSFADSKKHHRASVIKELRHMVSEYEEAIKKSSDATKFDDVEVMLSNMFDMFEELLTLKE